MKAYSKISNVRAFLEQPFLMWEYTTARKLMIAIFTPISINTFVHIYHPFGFGLRDNVLFLTISHSISGSLVMLFFYFVIPLGFNGYFKDQNRTIGRQIIWCITLILTAAATSKIVTQSFELSISYLSILLHLIALCIVPFLIWIFLTLHRVAAESPANQLIEIYATSGNDKVKVFLKNLLYIKSSSNYSEVYFIDENDLKMKLLRIPLSALSKQLNSEYCVRCHRSYIVNLLNLVKIEGNLNKSKIYFRNHEQTIPVSKSRRENVMDKLKALPISYIS